MGAVDGPGDPAHRIQLFDAVCHIVPHGDRIMILLCVSRCVSESVSGPLFLIMSINYENKADLDH